MPITDKDVLDAFDSFGDKFVQSMALQARLHQRGFDSNAIVNAINSLAERRLLEINSTGGVKRA